MKKVFDFVIKHYVVTIVLFCIVFVFFAFQVPNIHIDNSVDNMIPENNHVNMLKNKYKKVFGTSSGILVSIKSDNVLAPDFLKKLGELTVKLDKLDAKILKDRKKDIAVKGKSLLNVDSNLLNTIFGYLNSYSIKTLDSLNNYMNNADEMSMFGIDSKVSKKIIKIYNSLNDREKNKLINMLNPVFVKEAISIVNADYVEGGNNKFRVEKMIELSNINPEGIKNFKLRMKRWDIYEGLLINKKRTAASILVRLHDSKKEISETVLKYVKQEVMQSGFIKIKDAKLSINDVLLRNNIYIAGEPVVTSLLGKYMIGDLKILFPFVIIIVMIMLLISFRQFASMIIPLIAVLFSTVVVIGIMAIAQVSLTMISIVLPVLMIAVGSAYGIHVVNHYQLSKEKNIKDAVRHSLMETYTPVAMAAFTTVGGFAALLTNGIIPIKNFGIYTAIGVVFSFISALLLIPALIIAFKLKRKNLNNSGEEKNNRFLKFLSNVSIKRHNLLLFFGLIVLIVSIIGTLSVEVETDSIRMFKDSSYISMSDKFINKNFNGTSTIEVVLTNSKRNGILQPKYLKALDGLENHLKNDKKTAPYFGKTLSVVDYIKKAHKAMNGEKDSFYKIPDTHDEILNYMLILRNDTKDYCDAEGKASRIIISLKTGSTRIAHNFKKSIAEYFDSYFSQKNYPHDFFGTVALYLEVDRLVVQGQIFSMILSLLVVLILNAIVFRSLIEASISLVPLIIAIIFNFGIMGYFGILLDVGTSMIASIAIGIGIDYTIHFLNGYKTRYKKNNDVELSLNQTGLTTGRAILYNMVAVMFGFAVLPFSSFIPLINFGALIGITMFTTGIASMTMIPAILVVIGKMDFFKKIMLMEKTKVEKIKNLKQKRLS